MDAGALRERRGPARPCSSRCPRALRGDLVEHAERRRLLRRPRDRTTARFSGFAAATLGSFGGFSATAQVARGFRDPTLSDRYFRGPTGRGFITGNPDLEPETSLQLDLALRYSRDGLRAAALRLPVRHRGPDRALPDARRTSSSSATGAKRGSAGIEAEVQARAALEAVAPGDRPPASRASCWTTAPNLDGIPPATVTLRLRRELRARVGLGAAGRLRAPRRARAHRAAAARLHAAGRGVGVRLGSRVELRALGRNLLDEAYLVSPDSARRARARHHRHPLARSGVLSPAALPLAALGGGYWPRMHLGPLEQRVLDHLWRRRAAAHGARSARGARPRARLHHGHDDARPPLQEGPARPQARRVAPSATPRARRARPSAPRRCARCSPGSSAAGRRPRRCSRRSWTRWASTTARSCRSSSAWCARRSASLRRGRGGK